VQNPALSKTFFGSLKQEGFNGAIIRRAARRNRMPKTTL
jgi:hypothetical protein